MANHPDRGGDVETMKKINADHDAAFEILKKRHPEDGRSYYRSKSTMSDIRMKYGSQVFRGAAEETGFDRLGATA